MIPGIVASAVRVAVGPDYGAVVLADSPISFWRLDETSGSIAADEMGSYPAKYYGNPDLGLSPLIQDGSAVGLDGDNDYIEGDDNFLNSYTEMSFEAWIAPAGGSTIATHHSLAEYGWWFRSAVDTGADTFVLRINSSTNGSDWPDDLSTSPIQLGPVHYVVVTIGPTERRLYVDGVLEASDSVAPIHAPSAKPHIIGTRNYDNRYDIKFKGKVDAVAFYDYPLTATQIAEHYNAGIGA